MSRWCRWFHYWSHRRVAAYAEGDGPEREVVFCRRCVGFYERSGGPWWCGAAVPAAVNGAAAVLLLGRVLWEWSAWWALAGACFALSAFCHGGAALRHATGRISQP